MYLKEDTTFLIEIQKQQSARKETDVNKHETHTSNTTKTHGQTQTKVPVQK